MPERILGFLGGCRGLWDLHRLNRETALQWLKARREQDGITSSEQKRPRGKDELDLGMCGMFTCIRCIAELAELTLLMCSAHSVSMRCSKVPACVLEQANGADD